MSDEEGRIPISRCARPGRNFIPTNDKRATMRVLFLHVDYLEYEVKEKALKGVPDVPPSKRTDRIEEALVCFVSAEKRDEANPASTARAAAASVADIAGQLHTKRVVLYPYAHLSSSLAAPGPAQELIASLEKELVARGFDVHASPFGYYKSFRVAVKGHPLSELSREIVAVATAEGKEELSTAVKAEAKLVSHWHILEPNGAVHHLTIQDGKVGGFHFEGHDQLRRFATYEMAKSRGAKEEPPHVRLMRELELVDYEPGSDPGNLRYYPKGRLIKGLLEDFVTERLREYGTMEVECPVMYDFEVGMRVTKAFWDANKDFVAAYAKRWGKPILVEMWSDQFFYFVMKYEWNFVDANDKAAALTTDQIDTENAERFGITFTDEDGVKRHPLILHLSPSGAVERVIYALLEKAAAAAKAGQTPMLPLWLAPTQIRIVPVGADQLAYARSLLDRLPDVRADLDDSDDTLSKKIRTAEKEWIPYIVVVGKKEIESGNLNVRVRETKEQTEMSVDTLRKEIVAKTKGLPFRPLAEPAPLSARPIFRG